MGCDKSNKYYPHCAAGKASSLPAEMVGTASQDSRVNCKKNSEWCYSDFECCGGAKCDKSNKYYPHCAAGEASSLPAEMVGTASQDSRVSCKKNSEWCYSDFECCGGAKCDKSNKYYPHCAAGEASGLPAEMLGAP